MKNALLWSLQTCLGRQVTCERPEDWRLWLCLGRALISISATLAGMVVMAMFFGSLLGRLLAGVLLVVILRDHTASSVKGAQTLAQLLFKSSDSPAADATSRTIAFLAVRLFVPAAKLLLCATGHILWLPVADIICTMVDMNWARNTGETGRQPFLAPYQVASFVMIFILSAALMRWTGLTLWILLGPAMGVLGFFLPELLFDRLWTGIRQSGDQVLHPLLQTACRIIMMIAGILGMLMHH